MVLRLAAADTHGTTWASCHMKSCLRRHGIAARTYNFFTLMETFSQTCVRLPLLMLALKQNMQGTTVIAPSCLVLSRAAKHQGVKMTQKREYWSMRLLRLCTWRFWSTTKTWGVLLRCHSLFEMDGGKKKKNGEKKIPDGNRWHTRWSTRTPHPRHVRPNPKN